VKLAVLAKQHEGDLWLFAVNYDERLEPTELTSDPQILANEYITDVDHPTLGRVKMLGLPVKFSETSASIRECAPNFGQHTEEVLMSVLGYTWEDIEKLKDEEVI